MNDLMKRWSAAVLASIVLVGCSTGEAAEEAPTLTTAEVARGDLVLTAQATGTVEPVRSVEVKSKASGEILRLHVDVGDIVQPGSLLADIDPRDVRNRFEQADADLEVAKARAEISKAQLDRSTELLEAGVIAQQEHETKRLDYANALASLVKAETNSELAELQLSDVTIRAPMKGTVIQKNVEEGQVIQSASGNVSGGTTLFVMANLDEMQVRTLVDETDMGSIRAGLTATVNVEAFPDRTFRGVVEKIEPQATVQQNVTMFPVIVSLDNRAGLLKPGMNAEVEILIDQATNVLLVPNNAVVRLQDVGPAALALGLDVESMDLGQFMRAGRNGRSGARQAGAPAGSPQGQRQGSPAPEAGALPETAGTDGEMRPGTGRAAVDSLRARVDRGEISQDSMRVILQGMRQRRGDMALAPGAGFSGAGMAALPGDGAPAREARPAVVFVLGADSVPEPRVVQLGLNDWDNSQIVEGIEEGESLVVVSAAQLQAQQQEWLNRIRSRMGGGPFGGGGPRR